MHHRERNLRTGKLICDFIELHKRTQGGPPTWDEVVKDLMNPHWDLTIKKD